MRGDLFLLGYCSAVEVQHDRSTRIPGTDEQGPHPNKNLEAWRDSYADAVLAKDRFRDADVLRANGQVSEANSVVGRATETLEKSLSLVPVIDMVRPIMSDWDDEVIESA